MADLIVKQGDLEPGIFSTITNSATGLPVDLTTAESAQIRFAALDHTEIWVREAAINADPTTGKVSYSWQTGDTDIAGLFYAEFAVTWPSDRPQTYPSCGYLIIVIEPKL